MAAPMSFMTARTFSLSQRLRSTGSDTSFTVAKSASNTFTVTSGMLKVNTGSNSEWMAFTGATVSSTSITFTGVTRGMKFDAANLTDSDASLKKDHAIGVDVVLTYHSVSINKVLQKDANETITGTLNFLFNATKTSFGLPSYTTTQRDALVTVTSGDLIYNTTTGSVQIYSSGSWYDFATGTTTIPLATPLIAGRVKLLEAATDPTNPIVPTSNSTRILDANSYSAANAIALGGVVPANQQSGYYLVTDATYTGGSVQINRDGSAGAGANAVTNFVHRGTGNLSIACTENGDILLSTTGKLFVPPTVSRLTLLGETMSIGDWVYIKQSDGRAYKADNTTVEKSNVYGVVTGWYSNGNGGTGLVQTEGQFATSGLTAGSTYYLSGTPGALTATTPAHNSASVIPVKLGIANTTTSLNIQKQRMPRRIMFVATRAEASGNGAQTVTVGIPINYYTISTHRREGDAVETYGDSYGIYDGIASAQFCNSTSGGGTSTSVIAFVASFSGSGGMSAVGSISSNNVVLTWTVSGTAINADITGIAYELI